MTSSTTPNTPDDSPQPVCVMSFNAHDPSGALGLSADVLTLASMGVHPAGVICGVHSGDTRSVFQHYALDEEWLAEQARCVLEDFEVQAFKIGFGSTPSNLSVIAQICSDYEDVPVVSYMPDLSWWQRGDELEEYLDAFEELVLPQTSILVGNHATLWRWLLPEWNAHKAPTVRDLAQAAAQYEVPYVLATGIGDIAQQFDNVLATPESVLGSSRFDQLEGQFLGAGETLSAALAALLAAGNDLGASAAEALEYMHQSLSHSFRPGMGFSVPDRLFWAQGEYPQE